MASRDQVPSVSPYANLPSCAYWKTGVEACDPAQPADLYKKKFSIQPTDRIATAGSCFAQHIARHMIAHGFSVLDTEPPPPDLPKKIAQDYGYNLYSARFGNIYTSRQLLQLAQEATERRAPENWIWEKNGRFYDALRPSVEPHGHQTAEHVVIHRKSHLKHVRRMLSEVDLFIFTFGLTETWEHISSETVFPTAPGTIAGHFDPTIFRFKNLTFSEVMQDFLAFREILRELRPDVRFLVTVSPVPLTATASGNHILPATTYSKSVLRAVAGELHEAFTDVDYFPSYEIIASHPSKGAFYEANMRNVAAEGVNVVMNTFFAEHAPPTDAKSKKTSTADAVCEEALLEAFTK